MTHLALELCVLLRLLLLHLLLLLLHVRLRLRLLLWQLRLSHGLWTHHLQKRILIVNHHAIGELGLLLCHERLKLLLVETSGQAELRHHRVPLLHLRLRTGWGLRLWLLLLRHLGSLLHLTLLAKHVELLWCEIVEVEERIVVRLIEARHDCSGQQIKAGDQESKLQRSA